MGVETFNIPDLVSCIPMYSQCGIWFLVLGVASALPTRHQRLSLAEWGSYNFRDHKGSGTYAFGYDIEDPATNNVQFRQEERHSNGSVTGSYGYVEPNGHVRIMHYIADIRGYRVTEENPAPVNLHPHHEITTPAYQEDEPIFEGEFTPVIETVENDFNPQDNPHPIQFPSFVQLPPPVHDYEQETTYFNNDIAPIYNNAFTKPRRIAPLLEYKNPTGNERGTIKFRVG